MAFKIFYGVWKLHSCQVLLASGLTVENSEFTLFFKEMRINLVLD